VIKSSVSILRLKPSRSLTNLNHYWSSARWLNDGFNFQIIYLPKPETSIGDARKTCRVRVFFDPVNKFLSSPRANKIEGQNESGSRAPDKILGVLIFRHVQLRSTRDLSSAINDSPSGNFNSPFFPFAAFKSVAERKRPSPFALSRPD